MPNANKYDDYFFNTLYRIPPKSTLQTQKTTLLTMPKNSKNQSYRAINIDNRHYSYHNRLGSRHIYHSYF